MIKKSHKKLYISLITFIAIYTSFSFIISERYIHNGNLDVNNNLYNKALINYDKAKILNPFNSNINVKMAQTYEKTKDDKNAIKEYKKAIFKKFDDIDLRTNIINLLLRNGQIAETAKYFLFTNKKIFENKNFSIAVSKALFIFGNKDKANNLLKNIDSLEASTQRSIFNYLDENYEEAKREIIKKTDIDNSYKKAIIKETENLEFYKVSVAESLNEINQPYFGQIILEKMLKDKKESRDVYLYLGNSYLIQNNIEKARENLEKAKEKDLIFGLTYYLLAQVNFRENKDTEGLLNLKQAKNYGFKNN